MSRSLIILPDDSARPILDAIEGAARSLHIKMFAFSDRTIMNAVVAAHRRGVKVRVMLNPARRSGEAQNAPARRRLTSAGIEVKDSNPEFELTHEKSMVVDATTAFVKSLNWEAKSFEATRDYAIVTAHGHEVREILDCFESDWHRRPFEPGEDSHLIWCRTNGRARIARFIDGAKRSLWLQNERYQDPVIIEHLVRAARRGVKVHVMARPPHKLRKEKLLEGVGGLRILEDVGARIHRIKELRLHAKMLLADDERFIVGSINLAPGSFDDRRELAIEVDDAPLVHRLVKVVRRDWRNSHRLDLSDEALFAELEKHGGEGPDGLALAPAGRAASPRRGAARRAAGSRKPATPAAKSSTRSSAKSARGGRAPRRRGA